MSKRFCVLVLSCLFLPAMPAMAQSIFKKIENRARQKAGQRVMNKADKAMDRTMDEIEGAGKKDKAGVPATDTSGKTAVMEADTTVRTLFTSKYDFVPGEKLIVYEDFSRVELGDFPAGWNTDASAEVVTVEGKEGKWLKIGKQGSFFPEMINDIPDNTTLEWYLIPGSKAHPAPFVFNIASLDHPDQFRNYSYNIAWKGKHAVQLKFWPGTEMNAGKAASEVIAGSNANPSIRSKTNFTSWNNYSDLLAHIALWRQGARLRVYVNGEKVWDLPRAFDTATRYNAITLAMPRSFRGDEYYLIGRIRLATGAPDTRSKLLKEGKFVTHGILFDSGSDQIKQESYGVLKEIASLFRETPTLRVKIVGHTDNDGDEKANLVLSRKRAQAVKAALVNNFGVEAERMETDGMGESEPAEKDDTPLAKAANRRVVIERL